MIKLCTHYLEQFWKKKDPGHEEQIEYDHVFEATNDKLHKLTEFFIESQQWQRLEKRDEQQCEVQNCGLIDDC